MQLTDVLMNYISSFTLLDWKWLILFGISGTDEIDAKLSAITKPIKKLPITRTTLKQFKTYFVYLAFVASAAKASVRQKMLQKTLELIDKAGTAENIERWC